MRSRAPCARATTSRPSCCPAITTIVGRVSRSWRNAREGGPLPAPCVARRPLYPQAAWRSCRSVRKNGEGGGEGGSGVQIVFSGGESRRVQTIECDKFKWPRGVATGPDGAIYVTDRDAQCLFKFDKDGKLLNTVQNNLKIPYSVKIIQNQLYVADRSDLVKIFDTDCNIVGTIQTKECDPYDIVVGEYGLYVVGGGGKIAVYRCASNGEFIRHLNTNPSLNLSNIRSICFDSSGHLIVVNYGGSIGVYVFQPSGEHVASLSLASSGGIKCPAGIAIDDEGFVYVCDCWNDTVTVF